MTASRDVIVVGAGIVGCAVACELARRGASVEIIDERPIAMGATQASAGVLAPFIEAREGSPLLELTTRSLELYDEFVARITGESGVPVMYRRTGTVDVATSEAEMQVLRDRAGMLAHHGVAARILDALTVRSEEPHLADGAVGGLLIDIHGFVAAADLTRALATAARRHGAQLIEPSRVRRIGRNGGDVTVDTDRGSLTSGAVVIAAGSWSGEIAIDGIAARVPVRPVRGQLLTLAWTGTPLRRVTWSSRCYLVPWDDGTLLVGATVEEAGFDERTTTGGVRDLLDAACALLPDARRASFIRARVGLRPATPDDLPAIGDDPDVPGLVHATGHYRNGVLLAPITARLIGDWIVDGKRDPAFDAFNPMRFLRRGGS